MPTRNLYIVAVSALLFSIGHCQSIYNVSDLIDDLLTNYKTVLRPKINQSEAVQVNFSVELLSIIDFDEVHGSLYLNAILTLEWFDERLTWDPTSYNGVYSLFIESNKVWTPMVVHVNTIEKTEKIGSGDSWQLIRFMSDGKAFYYPGGLFSSSCNADVTYYPFDSHTCSVDFVAWGFGTTEIQLFPNKNEVLQTYFSPNGIWELTGSSVYAEYDGIQITADLTLQRKPLFVICNVILPIILLTFLNTIVFLIPIDSGERISYSITMLLAIAVFLTLVGDNLPKTSNPMSVFSYYLLLILTLSVFCGAMNIISLRCYFTDDQENINNHWRNLIKMSRFKCSNKCRKVSIHSEGKENNEKRESIQHIEIPHMVLPTEVKQPRSTFVTGDRNSDIDNVSWKDVSCALDRVCFVISLALTILITTIFIIVIVSRA